MRKLPQTDEFNPDEEVYRTGYKHGYIDALLYAIDFVEEEIQ